MAVAVSITSAFAQTPRPQPLTQTAPASAKSSAPRQQPHQLSPSDMEAFFDGAVPYLLAREDIAGAVVSVIKDSKVVFAKGYGYADVKARVPVSPTSTLFRVGSVSKTFTWTAVMQLVEQGKLDLDA